MTITAVIPAVYEPGIASTIRSILPQVDRVIVVLNNTTDPDATRLPALALDGVEVIDAGRCPGRKAQAINVALSRFRSDYWLIVDADTILSPNWVATARTVLALSPEVGGVGAIFHADREDGWLRRCQKMEWARYAETCAYTGKTFVLSGTAALIRDEALRMVGGYREDSITEDFALSVDLLGAGWQLASPQGCAVTTETMPTVAALFRQRRRWSLGAIQTVTRAGLHRHTAIYWRQQAMLLLAITAMTGAILTTGYAAATGTLTLAWWSLLILAVFATERVVTAPKGHRLFAAAVLPELAYAWVLMAAHVAALAQAVTGSRGTWHHPTPTPTRIGV